ncbi:MAG: GIY-YIG nuclease family protein [Fidelibacterota bacterium]
MGHTSDITKRLKQHNAGYSKATKRERPWNLVYTKTFKTRSEARQHEFRLKNFINKTNCSMY